MFNRIKKSVQNLLKGLHSAFSPVPALPPPQDKNKKSKGVSPSRSRRKNDSSEPYVRSSDRRTPPVRREQQPSARRSAKPSEPERIPKAAPKSAAPAKKVPPPMPKFVAPPVVEGKTRFCDLELSPEVLAATQTLKFEYCTPIQEKCLPCALAGRDLAAKAQTGTGKTAAFLASCITHILKHPKENARPGTCRVLVLSPTRELAIQIFNDAEDLAQYTALHNLVIFGGMDHKGQRDALLRPVDILVGTPGRIIDYSRSGHLDLSEAEILVIDEADRMLDMGFIPDVRRIVSKLPPTGERQTTLFSATLEPEILRLVSSWLHNPISLETEPDHLITDLIDQHFYAVLSEQKLPFLLNLIQTIHPERMLIFGNMKHKNRDLVRDLYVYGIDAELLSGDVAQEKRLKVLEKFRTGAVKILVATDVAARGIHVDGITHVVNYDLPEQADDYVHRVGRTGRAGEKGQSISFVCEVGAFALPAIEKYAGMTVHTVQPEPEMLVLPAKVRAPLPRSKDDYEPRHGGGFGGHGGHGGGSRGGFGGRRGSSSGRGRR